MADVVVLPRGGMWLQTPLGALQLGAPPETLKDTLTRKDGVPRIVVLPTTLVDVRKGLCAADIEFPIYWNLFVKKRPLIVVGLPAQEARIKAAIQECLLGPVVQDLRDDVPAGRHVPDLAKEQRYFRQGEYKHGGLLTLDDAIDFRAVEEGRVEVEADGKEVVLVRDEDGWFVSYDGAVQARLPLDPPPAAASSSEEEALLAAARSRSRNPFKPPHFGVTVLGRSHGFDPDPREKTTGFVLWIGGRGVLVDPPVRSTELLKEADIDAGLVDSLLLTHVHADHDAGTLQKALEAGRITLYTAPTIFQSYLRKWSALSAIPEPELRKLFDFRPVKVGVPVDVNGAKLIFRFTLHSIPTITFEAHYQGTSFNYSGDTLNDPQAIDEMFEKGFMDKERREELLHFGWQHDLIFHESGVPPLHTPLTILDAQSDDVKKRLRVLHVTPSRMKSTPSLIVAEPGRAATIDLPTEPPPELKVLRNLTILGRTRLFGRLPLVHAAELLAAAKEVHLKAGEQFIFEGADGGDLYVVTGGKASIQKDGREIKVYGLGESIGETAVFLEQKRNADVFALTDLELLRIDGAVARRVCKGTDIPALVARHAKVRAMDAWRLLDDSDLFAGMTTTQKNSFEMLLQPHELRQGDEVMQAGWPSPWVMLIATGEAQTTGFNARNERLARGQVIGDLGVLLKGDAQPRGAVAATPLTGFRIEGPALEMFLDENPGLRVRVQPWTAHATATLADAMAQIVTEHLGGRAPAR